MTELVLVRHGESIWHADNRYAGRSDIPLTDRGRRQAVRLGHWAMGAGLAAIWTSPLQRAAETAAIVGRAVALEPVSDERLSELNFGDLEGQTAEQILSRAPGVMAAFDADPIRHHLPGGEHPELAVKRGVACLDDIRASHPGERVLVVSHTTLIRLLLCRVLGLALADYRKRLVRLGNCSITRVRLDPDGGGTLIEFNRLLALDHGGGGT